jgi:hypothetical protein
MSECTDGRIQHNPAMVEDFLELSGGFGFLMRGKIGRSNLHAELASQSWRVLEGRHHCLHGLLLSLLVPSRCICIPMM